MLHGLYVLSVGLILGVPLAPLLGLWAAVASLIPQIGGALAGAPFVLLGFTEGATTGVICLIAFVLYLNFENHILSPIIVGEAVDLSAPTTMVGAIVGASVAGVPGALVSVPLLGAGKAIYLEATGQARRKGKGSVSVVQRVRQRFGRPEGIPTRGPRTPLGSLWGWPGSSISSNERVVIYDGATGTCLQGLDLTADDFGGPELEGCNELLVRHPARRHRASCTPPTSRSACDVVETNTFGALRRPARRVRHRRPGPRAQRRRRPPRPRGRRRLRHAGPPPLRRRLDRARAPSCPSLGQIRFAELRDAYEVQADGLLEGGVDLLIIETQFDLLGLKAAMIGCPAGHGRVGPRGPAPGAGHHRAHRAHAARHRDRRRAAPPSTRCSPDVIGLNCATGPDRDGRAPPPPRPSTPACPSPCMPNAGLPSVVDGQDALRPHARPAGRAPRALHHRARRPGRRRLLRHHAPSTSRRSSSVCRDLDAGAPARRCTRPAPPRSTRQVPFEQDTSFLIIGERTNANGSKKFREAMLEGDWDTCVADGQGAGQGGRPRPRRLRRLRRPRRHRRHGRDRLAASPPRSTRPAGARLHRAPGHRGRPAVASAAGPSSTRPTSRTARPRAPASTGCSRWPRSTARPSSACSSTRRARPATSSGRCGSPTASTTSPSSATASSRATSIFDALTFPLSTGDDDLRRDGMATIEAIRRIKAELPGRATPRSACPTCRFGLKPAARHVLNSRVPARVRRGRARLRHRARRPRSCRSTASPTSSARSCLDLIYDRRGTPAATAPTPTTTRCTRLLDLFADVKAAEVGQGGPLRLAGRAAALASASSTASATASTPTSTRPWPTGIAAAATSSTTSCSPA